ncbi:DNA-binding response regulator [Actinobacteria bacterium YIM 96077]|uniref:DNA-binding response regulator n=1 Tax=Phytoactinopolyspora halophila TaxID=1981511 RepID=A0A329QSG8_9ACTN|nr:response regulator transcription factor [Phytoactinopolyspora halophila]AYY14882.1 DNA-binding response regulator [Actinobacteria bacterium YIM 96077]RAW15340.1 DNA-binding response regulator [Phytoactinopolyspora halophila]
MRVLVVEDEPVLADAIAQWLQRESFAVDMAYDGEQALERIMVNDYDVVVLDRYLPKMHGDDVCRAIVDGDSRARVLMLTAATTVRARVEGLAIGADDYLTKPFAFAEMSARVHALARRSVTPVQPTLERAGIRIDPHRREATRDGRPIALGNREFAVLTELLRADGAVISAETLLEKAWDENIDPFTNTVRVTVMKLRRKLGNPPVIETVPGAGYRIP